MASSKFSGTGPSPPPVQSYYHALPADPRAQPQPQYVIVLPRYYDPPTQFCRIGSRRILCIATLFVLAGAFFLLWPSDPEISIVRLHLKRFQIRTFPRISLDITLDLTVKLRNKDFYTIDYNSLVIAIGYRGNQLGYATSNHGHLRARGSSYVNATLKLDAVEVLEDVIPLLADLAKGEIIFDTVMNIGGRLGLFFIELPLKGKVSCEIDINIHNQTIQQQNCCPE